MDRVRDKGNRSMERLRARVGMDSQDRDSSGGDELTLGLEYETIF